MDKVDKQQLLSIIRSFKEAATNKGREAAGVGAPYLELMKSS